MTHHHPRRRASAYATMPARFYYRRHFIVRRTSRRRCRPGAHALVEALAEAPSPRRRRVRRLDGVAAWRPLRASYSPASSAAASEHDGRRNAQRAPQMSIACARGPRAGRRRPPPPAPAGSGEGRRSASRRTGPRVATLSDKLVAHVFGRRRSARRGRATPTTLRSAAPRYARARKREDVNARTRRRPQNPPRTPRLARRGARVSARRLFEIARARESRRCRQMRSREADATLSGLAENGAVDGRQARRENARRVLSAGRRSCAHASRLAPRGSARPPPRRRAGFRAARARRAASAARVHQPARRRARASSREARASPRAKRCDFSASSPRPPTPRRSRDFKPRPRRARLFPRSVSSVVFARAMRLRVPARAPFGAASSNRFMTRRSSKETCWYRTPSRSVAAVASAWTPTRRPKASSPTRRRRRRRVQRTPRRRKQSPRSRTPRSSRTSARLVPRGRLIGRRVIRESAESSAFLSAPCVRRRRRV